MYANGKTVFGNWKVVEKIGSGSYGTVYRIQKAETAETIMAAMKVISIPQSDSEIEALRQAGMNDAEMRQLFSDQVKALKQEIGLMAKLKSTGHVVSYEDHDIVEHTGWLGWDVQIRMELLTPLRAYTKQNPFTRRDVIQLGIDMCKALEICQKYNIIHRDIKPDNIFVAKDGAYRLGDFGVARTIERISESELSQKGTYNFMAPEVYQGKERYDFSVDTYSLGIVLYRLLNRNRIPFYMSDPDTKSIEKANLKRFRGYPLPMPYYDNGRLGEIVLKAASYRPEDRYSSPLIMRKELEAILYNADDAQVIYPQGDLIEIPATEYPTGTKTQLDSLGLDPELSDGTKTQLDIAGSQKRSTKTRTRVSEQAPISGAGKAKNNKKIIRRILILVILAMLVIGTGFAAAYLRRENKNQAYEQYMNEAQSCRDTDPEKALGLYLDAQALVPEVEAPYVAYAFTLYNARDYDGSISYIKEHLASEVHAHTESEQAQLNEIAGASYFEIENYSEAAYHFRLSAEGDTITATAMRDYAVSLGRMGDIDAAENVLTQMANSGATGSVITYIQSEIQLAKESYLAAEEGFRSVMEHSDDLVLQKRSLGALTEVYRACMILNNTDNSPISDPALKLIELLEQGIVELNLYYDPSYYELLGLAYYEARYSPVEQWDTYLDKSAENFTRALELGMNTPNIFQNLYVVYNDLQDYQMADHYVLQYMETYPQDYTPHAMRSLLYMIIEGEKTLSQRDYSIVYEEFEIAKSMIRSTDDQAYFEQAKNRIDALSINGWDVQSINIDETNAEPVAAAKEGRYQKDDVLYQEVVIHDIQGETFLFNLLEYHAVWLSDTLCTLNDGVFTFYEAHKTYDGQDGAVRGFIRFYSNDMIELCIEENSINQHMVGTWKYYYTGTVD